MIKIEVAAGVIRDASGRLLICRRKGALDGLWEFPGGKREAGESFADCLKRELMEELDLPVSVGEALGEVVRVEGDREIRLVFLLASPECTQCAPSLHVHGKSAWVRVDELDGYPFCPADQAFLDMNLF